VLAGAACHDHADVLRTFYDGEHGVGEHSTPGRYAGRSRPATESAAPASRTLAAMPIASTTQARAKVRAMPRRAALRVQKNVET
jgi:hypothetical protein